MESSSFRTVVVCRSRTTKTTTSKLLLLLVVTLSTFLLIWSTCFDGQVEANSSPSREPIRNQQRPLQRLNDKKAAEEKLSKLCRLVGSMKRISTMQDLINTLKIVITNRQEQAAELNEGQTIIKQRSYLRCLYPNAMSTCLEQAEAFLDLEPILEEKENICHPKHIERIEAYHERHHMNQTKSSSSSSWTCGPRQFFTLYTTQVAFMCKSNMLHSLLVADREFIGPEDYVQVIPWLSSEPTTGSSCNIGDHLDQEQPQVASKLANLRTCTAQRALAGIRSINELTEALEGIDSVSKEASVANAHSTTNSNGPNHQSLRLIVPESQRQLVDNVLDSCRRFQAVYSRTVMPIVRLTKLGYDPRFPNFNKLCHQNTFVQRWFSITLICTSMLKLGDNKYQTTRNKEDESLIIIDEDNPDQDNRQQQQQQQMNVNDGNQLVNLKNPIDDELWVGKYVPTKMSKLRTNFNNRIARIFNLQDVDDHIVFRRTVSDTGRYLISLILVSLSLVATRMIK